MHMLNMFVDRGVGTMGWRISKFHELLHVQRDVMHFSSPTNYDASKTERGLQQWVKTPSTTVAKRGGDTYNSRVALRLSEMSALEKALTNLVPTLTTMDTNSDKNLSNDDINSDIINDDIHLPLSVPPTAKPKTKSYLVQLTRKNNNHFAPFAVRWMQGMKKKHKDQNPKMDQDLLDWLYRNEYVTDGSFIYSEVELKDGTILRGTPGYRQTGPWYDWVTQMINIENTDTTLEMPFQVHGFFLDSNNKCHGFGRSGDWLDPPEVYLELLTAWKMKDGYFALDLDTIQRSRVFALEVPRISKLDSDDTAQVGNMSSLTNNPTVAARADHLAEVFVFSERIYNEAASTCWPQIFVDRDWEPEE